MPIQHVNNDILKAMRRHTTKEEIIAIIQKLRAVLPDIHIRTSIIVGFPGETDEHFAELKAFVKEYGLNHIGIFTYSREEGTPAGRMENQIPEEIKVQRQSELAAVQQKVVEKFAKKMIGKTLDVVIEGVHPESEFLLVGRYFGQAPEIDSHIIINDAQVKIKVGDRYKVKISAVAGYDLLGTALEHIPFVKKKKGTSLKVM